MDLPDSVDEAQQIKVEFIRLKSYENEHSTDDIKVIGIESLESLRHRVSSLMKRAIDLNCTLNTLYRTYWS